MSIAVTAVVAPSRRLRWLLAVFCASLLAAALAVGLVLPMDFASRLAALAPLLAGLVLGREAASRPTARRIDISGLGQLRLTVQQDVRPPVVGMPVTLLAGSTVWSCCMLLRLRAESGAVWRLVLLPDSVSAGEYRALAVALRAVGAMRPGAAIPGGGRQAEH
ncbi:protein YgfX [Massilia niastensis]|uniref:protein YgfX n=1 Tax=Massilia niastensis TaxID=544911 RepID=UPI0003A75CAF|nr:protein YgfX [Massilia niastensis]